MVPLTLTTKSGFRDLPFWKLQKRLKNFITRQKLFGDTKTRLQITYTKSKFFLLLNQENFQKNWNKSSVVFSLGFVYLL